MKKIVCTPFGKTKNGEEISLFRLENNREMLVNITNLGCAIVSICIKDRNGDSADVVLGYDTGEEYEAQIAYFGVILGRYANRIRDGKFMLNGKSYQLPVLPGGHHSHGGKEGFDRKLWKAEVEDDKLVLKYHSEDGEEGYPGNLDIETVYSVSDENALIVNYKARSDQDTIINISNHSYFNLNGHGSQDACSQYLKIYAHNYTEYDNEMLTTGRIRSVEGTPFDFLKSRQISERLNECDAALRISNGYDLNYVLDKEEGKLGLAAELYDKTSARIMEVYTTKPGLQFYSGNGFPYAIKGKKGIFYEDRSGICLETQFFPNSIAYSNFPASILKKDELYDHTTIYKFKSF